MVANSFIMLRLSRELALHDAFLISGDMYTVSWMLVVILVPEPSAAFTKVFLRLSTKKAKERQRTGTPSVTNFGFCIFFTDKQSANY